MTGLSLHRKVHHAWRYSYERCRGRGGAKRNGGCRYFDVAQKFETNCRRGGIWLLDGGWIASPFRGEAGLRAARASAFNNLRAVKLLSLLGLLR